MAGLLKRQGGSAQRSKFNEINITPMVDVMLVLLVIFMVAAPMLTSNIDVDLPGGKVEVTPIADEPLVELSIQADGQLVLGEQKISKDTLKADLDKVMQGRQDTTVYLRADAKNSYAQVFEIMGLLQINGYQNISLVGAVTPQN